MSADGGRGRFDASLDAAYNSIRATHGRPNQVYYHR